MNLPGPRTGNYGSARLFIGVLFMALCALPQEARASDRIEWRWRPIQVWEYPATAAVLTGAFYFRFGVASQDGDWQGGILFDEWVQERTALDHVPTRRTMVSITDSLYLGLIAYRLVDSVFVPGVAWGNWKTALQMSMIDIEAFGFAAFALWGQQALFGRERPYVGRCPGYAEESCDPQSAERNRSFFAGHPAVAMTAAALTCTHHRHLPLYDGAGDALACGLTLCAAALTGYGRVVTEMHYPSDVAVGFGIGAVAGWALPELLHYAHEIPDARQSSGRQGAFGVRAMVMPMVGEDRAGAGVGGVF